MMFYSWKKVLVSIVFIFGLVNVSIYANAATLLYRNDFEGSDWRTGLSNTDGWVDVTTHDPHSGNYALRGTLKRNDTNGNTFYECRTGLPGRGTGVDVTPSGLASNTPNAIYISYWLRYDNFNSDPEKTCAASKLGYLRDVNGNVAAAYIGGRLETCQLEMHYCNDGQKTYCDQTWALNNWGYMTTPLNNSNVNVGVKGKWRHIELYWNYAANPDYFMMWVDGHLLTNGTYPDGKYSFGGEHYLKGNFHMKGFSILYENWFNTDGATNNGTECAGSWQIDDIEIWDDLPGKTRESPMPSRIPNFPTNISID